MRKKADMSSPKTVSQEEKMVTGMLWATISDFVSRFLGVLYIIPWYAWMDKAAAQANGLYSMGYNVYGTILLLSTVGLNAAIAKQVSRYNALGQESEILQMIRTFLKLMCALGAFAAAIMYFGAPFFAILSGQGKELVVVIRSLTLAVFMFPMMSVLRGVFQGYNDLKTYALSQIAEQFVRVIWMLVTAYTIMKLGSKDYVDAVVQSTFAAVIGMLASIGVLLYYLSQRGLLGKLFQKEVVSSETNGWSLLVETVKVAIPFVIVGAAIQIFQLIDQVTFINLMARASDYSKAELNVLYTYMSGNPSRIVMILLSVATSIASVGLALITESFTKKDYLAVARMVTNNLQMTLLFILPAITGGVLLAPSLYGVFYGQSEAIAISLFVGVLLQTIVLAFYTVMGPMLQALFENRKAIRYFLYGLVVKCLLQVPAIYLFYGYGPIVTTTLALLVSVLGMYWEIQRVSRFKHGTFLRQSLLTVLMTVVMMVAVLLGKAVLGQFFIPDNRIEHGIYLAVLGSLGALVYGFLALLTRSGDRLIGVERANKLRQKLRLS